MIFNVLLGSSDIILFMIKQDQPVLFKFHISYTITALTSLYKERTILTGIVGIVLMCVCYQLSRVQLFAIPQTVTC